MIGFIAKGTAGQVDGGVAQVDQGNRLVGLIGALQRVGSRQPGVDIGRPDQERTGWWLAVRRRDHRGRRHYCEIKRA